MKRIVTTFLLLISLSQLNAMNQQPQAAKAAEKAPAAAAVQKHCTKRSGAGEAMAVEDELKRPQLSKNRNKKVIHARRKLQPGAAAQNAHAGGAAENVGEKSGAAQAQLLTVDEITKLLSDMSVNARSIKNLLRDKFSMLAQKLATTVSSSCDTREQARKMLLDHFWNLGEDFASFGLEGLSLTLMLRCEEMRKQFSQLNEKLLEQDKKKLEKQIVEVARLFTSDIEKDNTIDRTCLERYLKSVNEQDKKATAPGQKKVKEDQED